MNSDVALRIELSTRELWLVLEQSGPALILGLENPYQGWLATEIAGANEAALNSLIERDLVRKVADNEIALDEALAALVGICAHAEHTLIIQAQSAGAAETQRYVHFAAGFMVEQAEVAPGQYQLTAFADQAALAAHLEGVLRFNSPTIGGGEQFDLAEAALFGARDDLRNGRTQPALERLQQAGLTGDQCQRLMQTLASPVASSSVVVLVNRTQAETQHVIGFAALEGPQELWLLQPHDQHGVTHVTFQPASGAMLRARFAELLP